MWSFHVKQDNKEKRIKLAKHGAHKCQNRYQFKFKYLFLYQINMKRCRTLSKEIRLVMFVCNLSCWYGKWLDFATSLEPGQPAHLCSLTRLYTAGWPTSGFHLDIPKMIMDSSQNRRHIIPFKKFSRLRVQGLIIPYYISKQWLPDDD